MDPDQLTSAFQKGLKRVKKILSIWLENSVDPDQLTSDFQKVVKKM